MRQIAVLLFILLLASICVAHDKDIIRDTIVRIAKEKQFDPALAVSIAIVESGLNPRLIGQLGEVGVFQLRTEYHNVQAGNIEGNIRTAIDFLKELQKTCPHRSGLDWTICYNLGMAGANKIKHPKLFPYYIKVTSIYMFVLFEMRQKNRNISSFEYKL